MDFKRKNTLIRILILLPVLGILAITFSLLLKNKEDNQALKDFRPTSKLAYAKGITFTEYRGEKKVYSVSIDTFSVERARLGPFAIGPLRMAQFNKVNVDLYLEAIESEQARVKTGDNRFEEGLLDFQIPISDIRKNLPAQLKRIRGFKLNDLSLNLWKNGVRVFRISSDTAELDQETRDLVFAGHATIDSGENGKLLSHRIRWSSKTRLFSATGPYLLAKNEEKREGTGIAIDYLFRRINYRVPKE